MWFDNDDTILRAFSSFPNIIPNRRNNFERATWPWVSGGGSDENQAREWAIEDGLDEDKSPAVALKEA